MACDVLSSPVTYSTSTRPDDDKLLIKQPGACSEPLISSRSKNVTAGQEHTQFVPKPQIGCLEGT